MAVTRLAAIVLDIHPFAPQTRPEGWEEILDGWMQGLPVAEISATSADERLEFIEETLAYRLPWELESVRVRAAAHDDANSEPWTITDLSQALAVAAVEAWNDQPVGRAAHARRVPDTVPSHPVQ